MADITSSSKPISTPFNLANVDAWSEISDFHSRGKVKGVVIWGAHDEGDSPGCYDEDIDPAPDAPSADHHTHVNGDVEAVGKLPLRAVDAALRAALPRPLAVDMRDVFGKDASVRLGGVDFVAVSHFLLEPFVLTATTPATRAEHGQV